MTFVMADGAGDTEHPTITAERVRFVAGIRHFILCILWVSHL